MLPVSSSWQWSIAVSVRTCMGCQKDRYFQYSFYQWHQKHMYNAFVQTGPVVFSYAARELAVLRSTLWWVSNSQSYSSRDMFKTLSSRREKWCTRTHTHNTRTESRQSWSWPDSNQRFLPQKKRDLKTTAAQGLIEKQRNLETKTATTQHMT